MGKRKCKMFLNRCKMIQKNNVIITLKNINILMRGATCKMLERNLKRKFGKGQGESRSIDPKKEHIPRKRGCLPEVTDGIFEINFCEMVRTEA